jgi:hypothetical protein
MKNVAAVCWAEDRIYLENFFDLLKSAMPQKKFQILFERPWDNNKWPVQGWNEMESASQLKQALDAIEGVPPEDYFVILGLDPSKNSSSGGTAEDISNKNKKGGKSSKAKGGKRKK